jgi:hypothetical protein
VDCVLTSLGPFHGPTFTAYLSKINFSIIFISIPRSTNWLFSLTISEQNVACFSYFSSLYVQHVIIICYPTLFDHPNNGILGSNLTRGTDVHMNLVKKRLK